MQITKEMADYERKKYRQYWYSEKEADEMVELFCLIGKEAKDIGELHGMVNTLLRSDIKSVEKFNATDIDELRKVKGLGNTRLNVIRRLRGLPEIFIDKPDFWDKVESELKHNPEFVESVRKALAEIDAEEKDANNS